MSPIAARLSGEWHAFALIATRHAVRSRIGGRASYRHTALERFPRKHGKFRSVPTSIAESACF